MMRTPSLTLAALSTLGGNGSATAAFTIPNYLSGTAQRGQRSLSTTSYQSPILSPSIHQTHTIVRSPYLVANNNQQFHPQRYYLPSAVRGTYGSNYQTRVYSSFFDDDDRNKKGGILSKIADKAKEFLPQNWFKDEKTKKAELQRKKINQEVSGGLSTLLKDAPLPIRMMGKLVAPLLSSLATQMKEQGAAVEDLLEDAQRLIVSDPYVSDALGEPIVASSPFSQSSSSVSINGKTKTQFQLSFQVQGSYRSGTATLVASGDEKASIDSLRVNVAGRWYDVNVTGRFRGGGAPPTNSYGKKLGKNSNIKKDDVIDVEFVEKK